jgi:hypothetical protein
MHLFKKRVGKKRIKFYMRGGDFRIISFLFPPPSYIPPREEKKVSAGFSGHFCLEKQNGG